MWSAEMCGKGLLLYAVFAVELGLLGKAVAEDPPCDCPGGCGKEGIASPDGRKMNVAYGKFANISSRYTQGHWDVHLACAAVNGRPSSAVQYVQDPDLPNCIHTAVDDTNAWWQVDLGHSYAVESITVYGRRGWTSRMASMTVEVDSVTCHTFPSDTRNLPEKMDITCGQSVTGRFVTFQKHAGVYDIKLINICEVQVWTCVDGFYGENCSSDCGHCDGDGVCNKLDGSCPDGCQPGFDPSDPLCKKPCVDGFYGENCSSDCGHCRGDVVCNKVDGSCPDGCQPGFDPSDPLCKKLAVHHDVMCGQTEMSFSISTSDLQFVPKDVTLSDPRCHVHVTANRLTGRTPLNACGTSLHLTNNSLIFSNFILIPPNDDNNDSASSNIIHVIPIECRYKRVSDLRLSYLPMVRQILFTETGVGQFQFRIDQFKDASFASKVKNAAYPLKMTSSETVYLQLSLGESVLQGEKGYGMDVETCVASPSPSMMAVHNDSSEELIRNSCPVNPDVQLIESQSQDRTRNASGPHYHFRFSFKPIIPSDSSKSDKKSSTTLMYIHCRVSLCPAKYCHSSAECAPRDSSSGAGGREKRAVSEFGHTRRRPTPLHLSTGPLLIFEDDDDASDRATSTFSSSVIYSLAATAGMATLIAVFLVIAWALSRKGEGQYEVTAGQQ